MWMCPRCHTENKDGYNVCDGCGAQRSAGRFGSGMPVSSGRPPTASYTPPVQTAPRVQPPAEKAPRLPSASAPRADYIPQDIMPRKKTTGSALTSVGILLCILLPALCIMIAWRQFDILSPVLFNLLFGQNAAPGIIILSVYLILAFIAILLSLIPGLWALSHGRLHRRLARIEQIL